MQKELSEKLDEICCRELKYGDIKRRIKSVVFAILFVLFIVLMSWVGFQIDKYYTQEILLKECICK